jgi:NTE family protein
MAPAERRRGAAGGAMSARRGSAVGLVVAAALGLGSARELPASEPPAPRPKIGIAFSGGGAKGCAHVGVLRVLEELGVPVDYAAGTSMGSIIGGLYAAGRTPDELERLMLEIDWADALTDKPGREQLAFRRKDDDLRFLPDIELGIGRGGLRWPTGLRSGQKLNFLLRHLTLPVRTVTDFDRLPIPFRAVATDIGNGQMVVLDRGDLARALRASMAIPTVFSAVEYDGRLLVDGGVTNNVPVDVVRAMGADVVIAIDIGSPLTGEEEVGRSYLKILGQTLGLITRANMVPRLASADVVIVPDVASYGTLEFDAAREIVARGEAEARKLAELLRPYALSPDDYRAWRESRRRPQDAVPTLAAVGVAGNVRVDRRVLENAVRTKPGTPFPADSVRADLDRLFGLGDFESVDVELVDAESDTQLVYRVHEKSWGPTYLRLGVGFVADFEGSNDLALRAAVNRTRLNALGGEWRTEAQLGSDRRLETELHQPLSFRSGWFVEPAAAYRRRIVPIFEDGERLAELDLTSTAASLDVGYAFGRYGEARLGLERGWIEGRRLSGSLPDEIASVEGESLDRAGARLQAVVDTLDSSTLPRNGGLVRLTAFRAVESLGADDEYTKLELESSRFRTRGRHTVFGNVDGGASPGGALPVYDRFALGGFFSLSGFETGELRGDNYALARFGYYYRLGKFLHLGGYVEAARVAAETSDLFENPTLGATALLIADTPAGPVYAGVGSAEQGHRKVYLLFGRPF